MFHKIVLFNNSRIFLRYQKLSKFRAYLIWATLTLSEDVPVYKPLSLQLTYKEVFLYIFPFGAPNFRRPEVYFS